MKWKTWLFAIAMGMLLPNLFFSIVEKTISPKPPKPTEETVASEDCVEQTESQYSGSDFIKVILPNGAQSTMELDTYITGVVLGEMPWDFDLEALKAQAVVARTYALKRSTTGQKHSDGAVCTDHTCCQAYRSVADYLSQGGTQESADKVSSAVVATSGQILTYQGAIIEATYYSCSGGRTEDAMAVWGTDIPYLQAVDSPGEESAAHYTDSVKFSGKEFANRLGINPKGSPATWLGAVTYTNGGGVDTMVIAGKVFKGTTLRQKLELRSTVFTVTAVGDSVHIVTKGFGHRVGMSQYGAEAMAVKGNTYGQILAHYYPGTELKTYGQN